MAETRGTASTARAASPTGNAGADGAGGIAACARDASETGNASDASDASAATDAAALHALESAAFSAWPALEEECFEGWHLRYARGYTKRANSANAGAQARALDGPAIDEIERRYRARGLPVIFRLVSFADVDALDRTLAARGYAHVDPSLVMAAPLGDSPPEEAGAVFDSRGGSLVTLDIESWLEAFQSVSGHLGPGQSTHLEMLRAIRSPTAFAVDARDPVACCALGVAAGANVGLFDVATHVEARGRGRATRLCAQIMGWGRGQGASTAFLQVLARNAGARRLYERLGFREVYEYGYRVRA